MKTTTLVIMLMIFSVSTAKSQSYLLGIPYLKKGNLESFEIEISDKSISPLWCVIPEFGYTGQFGKQKPKHQTEFAISAYYSIPKYGDWGFPGTVSYSYETNFKGAGSHTIGYMPFGILNDDLMGSPLLTASYGNHVPTYGLGWQIGPFRLLAETSDFSYVEATVRTWLPLALFWGN